MERRNYKIRCMGGAQEEFGDIVGPFGVARDPTQGFYRVTHLHSGLKIGDIGSTVRSRALAAAHDLSRRIEWWASHKPERIAEENGMTKSEIRRTILDVAKAHHCDGKDDERIYL